MLFETSLSETNKTTLYRAMLVEAYCMDEEKAVRALLDVAPAAPAEQQKFRQLAKQLVEKIRSHKGERKGVELLIHRYDLSCEEGVLLMCLAEALLRVPDKATEKLLIRDKLGQGSWDTPSKDTDSSTLMNLASWGLKISGKLLAPQQGTHYFQALWQQVLGRVGEPVIRKVLREMMKTLGEHFIVGTSIENAWKNSKDRMQQGFLYSYDMLGEVARTQKDADRYFMAYRNAIQYLGQHTDKHHAIYSQPSISIKLSALHPRYEWAKQETVIPALSARLLQLCQEAMTAHISLTIDAEEANRLDLSLDIFEKVYSDFSLQLWDGLGMAVQAYQKRAFYLLDWVIHLARMQHRRIPIRLVKGAYWDTEIKLGQMANLTDYPVFTRKSSTDLSYLACAQKMLDAPDAIYAQFATHNAYSAAAVFTLAQERHVDFEFQNLQGMGGILHDVLVNEFKVPSRIYAPVGAHEDLLPYLVRRLLENGANTSFVNQIIDEKIPVQRLVVDPVQQTKALDHIRHPKIPRPDQLYPRRKNSRGLDLTHWGDLQALHAGLKKAAEQKWLGVPTVKNKQSAVRETRVVASPSNRSEIIGEVHLATALDVQTALNDAHAAWKIWYLKPVAERAALLDRVADLMEEHRHELMYLAIFEAGKVLSDAVAEVREAVDFCRYYAEQARLQLVPQTLQGPTGESNVLHQQGRGVIACISPWNFPIAIFSGQVAAALVAGNAVVAKPAGQTVLCAALVVKLFYAAGMHQDVLQLLPGSGGVVGAALVRDKRTQGVLFTGSNETANAIQRDLDSRGGAIAAFVAETGGINALIADSTALPEQLVSDVLISAFGSSGQRCSALRILLVQEEIADTVITMLAGAMAELTVGRPEFLATDLGPVIDRDAKNMLENYLKELSGRGRLIYQVQLPPECQQGTFFAPVAYELPALGLVKHEIFGPVLHVVRFKRENMDQVINEINDLGYGLTFGIHTRIESMANDIIARIQAGNIYVNRSMIGAVVGVQPFGGMGLSGTGPKAGGPHYLSRLCNEKTVTINTTATGGNTQLMSLDD